MPTGSGSHPSNDSSGAVEAECQQEAEATHPAPARGQWKQNASMKRQRMILMVMLMKMVSIISMISMISMIPMICFQTMVWASMRVIVVIVTVASVGIVVIVVCTYVCMLLLMTVTLVFSHPTGLSPMKPVW